MMFDPLPDDLAGALAREGERLGAFHRLHFRSDVASTNDLALTLALAGAPEGTSVLADAQRAGRGRRSHSWFSPPGAGVYLSVITRPRGPAAGVPFMTLAAGVAVASAVRAATGLPVEIKWPNDLMLGRPWRKLGGVLAEATGAGGAIDAVIIGVGVNLLAAAYPRELADRATSIETELGRPLDRAPLVVTLLAELRRAVAGVPAQAPEAIRHEWRRLAAAGLGGAPVRWDEGGQTRRGRAIDIDLDGALLVETRGTLERVIGGDVHWDGLSRG